MMVLIIGSSVAGTFFPHLHIYQSFWYRGLLLLLCLSLFLCTVKSLQAIASSWHSIPKPNTFETIKKQQMPQLTTSQTIIKHLEKSGYQIRINNTDQQTIILAQKGILNRLAPHILHVSLLIVFLGAFMYSFSERTDVPCYVSESVSLPDTLLPGVAIQVDDFVTLYDTEGNIDNWQSKITLLNQDQVLITGEVQVNQPFTYRGVKFYQSAYGYEHLIKVTGENAGEYRLPEEKVFQLAGQQFRLIQGHNGLMMNIYDGVTENNIPITEGTTINFPNDTTVEYKQLSPYTVLNVKNTPGSNIVMLGLVLMSFSSLPFWSTRYRKLHIFIDHQQQQWDCQVICKDKNLKDSLKEQVKQLIKG
jgi:cytochrome c biogenesis protein ResB